MENLFKQVSIIPEATPKDKVTTKVERKPAKLKVLQNLDQSYPPKAPYAECGNCPLQNAPMVSGMGPDNPRLAIVGEAPGRQEVKTGVPFIGPSGRLLNKVLSHFGIDRDEVYVTNTVLCHPTDGNKNRPPTAHEIRCCSKRLIEEVKAKKPQAVLTLGAVPSKALLNQPKAKITDLRVGGAKHSELIDAPVVATFHPAAALRAPERFPDIVNDVRKITQPIQVKWEPTQFEVIHDTDQAISELIRQCAYPDVALDIETAPPYDRHKPKILCVGVSEQDGRATVYAEELMGGRFFETLDALFADSPTKWAMQNGKSVDIQSLWGAGVSNAYLDNDTLLMHYMTDERKGIHKLELLATEILGAPNYKAEMQELLGTTEPDEDWVAYQEQLGKKRPGAQLADIPRDILYRYNAMDCDVTHRLLKPLRDSMESDGVVWPYENIVIPAIPILARAEFEGLTVDLHRLNEIEADVIRKMEASKEEAKKWVANPNAAGQIKEALAELGIDVPNTQKETLKTIDHEFVAALREYKQYHKLFSTYLRGLRKCIIDGRIHTQFNIHGTETGRLSSSKPNIQNQPRGSGIRSIFTASAPDRVLISADYSQIELRVAAGICNDPWLIQVFEDGRDIHTEVARELYGEDFTDDERVYAKAVNFGIPYDRREDAIAHQLKKTNDRKEFLQLRSMAKQIIEDWQRRSPTIWEYHELVRNTILRQGYLRSIFGRLRRFWLVTPENRLEVYREGYNFPISSPASDITTLSLIKLGNDPYMTQADARPVITVHDSLTFDVPLEHAKEVEQYIKEQMFFVFMGIPCPVETKMSYRWSDK